MTEDSLRGRSQDGLPPAPTTAPAAPPADAKARDNQLTDYMQAKDQGWNPYLASPAGGMAKDGSVMTQQEAGPAAGTTTRNYRVMGAIGEGSGVAPMSRGTGGFVGSATNAEAERDLRATKLGVDRGTLDRMEGRATAATGHSMGSLWDRFGGDARRRYESLVNDAANDEGPGARSRGMRKLAAAQALLAPYMDDYKTQQADLASRNSLAGQRYSTDASLAGKRLDAEASLAGSRLIAQQQAEKNRLDAEQKNAELGVQGVDALTRRMALTQKPQTGADQLIQHLIGLSQQMGAETDPAKRAQIAQQIALLKNPDSMAALNIGLTENQ